MSELTLYHITDEIQTLTDSLEMTEPESPERLECEAELQRYFEQLPAKVDDVCKYLAHLEAQASMAADEIDRLTSRKRRFEAATDRLKDYCKDVLLKLPEPKKGPRKLEGSHNTLQLRPVDRVAITDESVIPERFKTACVEIPLEAWAKAVSALPDDVRSGMLVALKVQDVKVRLADVKKEIKAGNEVAGADIAYDYTVQRK